MVLNIFNGTGMASPFNSIYVALISKKFNPLFVTDFRPISLYNVIYKLVAKVITIK